MPTADQYVAPLIEQVRRGIYYSQAGGRCRPDIYGYADCSGFTCYGMMKAGVDLGCTGSFALARIGHAQNRGISIDQARRTRGAWLFRGINQGQGGEPGVDPGHIATSLGNGNTIEARGHIAGVGVFPFDSLTWDWACLPVGLTGFGTAPTAQVSTPSSPVAVPDPEDPNEETFVLYLHSVKGDREWRPRAVSVINKQLFVWNVSVNPFKQGKLLAFGDAHVLNLDDQLAPGEWIIGVTDENPNKVKLPNGQLEVLTNWSGKHEQPRHILTPSGH
jgi:hypothetical protein